MTFFRTTAILAASVATLGFSSAASAQISLGDEYYTANDEARDSFGEDYDSQKREADERRALGRSLSKTAQNNISIASKALQSGDHDKAISQSLKGLAVHGTTPYEKSIYYQLNAAANIAKKDYSGAKSSYEKALATGGMNEEEESKVSATLAKLETAGVQ